MLKQTNRLNALRGEGDSLACLFLEVAHYSENIIFLPLCKLRRPRVSYTGKLPTDTLMHNQILLANTRTAVKFMYLKVQLTYIKIKVTFFNIYKGLRSVTDYQILGKHELLLIHN